MSREEAGVIRGEPEPFDFSFRDSTPNNDILGIPIESRTPLPSSSSSDEISYKRVSVAFVAGGMTYVPANSTTFITNGGNPFAREMLPLVTCVTSVTCSRSPLGYVEPAIVYSTSTLSYSLAVDATGNPNILSESVDRMSPSDIQCVSSFAEPNQIPDNKRQKY